MLPEGCVQEQIADEKPAQYHAMQSNYRARLPAIRTGMSPDLIQLRSALLDIGIPSR